MAFLLEAGKEVGVDFDVDLAADGAEGALYGGALGVGEPSGEGGADELGCQVERITVDVADVPGKVFDVGLFDSRLLVNLDVREGKGLSLGTEQFVTTISSPLWLSI